MSGAVLVAKARNGRGGDFNFAAWRRQRRGFGVAAKSTHDTAVPWQSRQYQLAPFPELVEIERIGFGRSAVSAAAPPTAACRYWRSIPARRQSHRLVSRSAPAMPPTQHPSTAAVRHAQRAAMIASR